MLAPEQIYHIYNHANGNESLFRNDDNFIYFLEKYDEHLRLVANTYAYCLMPNHFHLLVKIKDEKSIIGGAFQKFGTFGKLSMQLFISKQFSNFFSSYTQSYNKVYNRKGSLFMPNFKKNLIENITYLKNVLNYIHMNPVLHGFVKAPFEWKYSSYNAYFSGKETKIPHQLVLEAIECSTGEFLKKHNLKDAEKYSTEMGLQF
ncbi:MAG: transposase [Bacteroidales bacterium]